MYAQGLSHGMGLMLVVSLWWDLYKIKTYRR